MEEGKRAKQGGGGGLNSAPDVDEKRACGSCNGAKNFWAETKFVYGSGGKQSGKEAGKKGKRVKGQKTRNFEWKRRVVGWAAKNDSMARDLGGWEKKKKKKNQRKREGRLQGNGKIFGPKRA